MCDCVPLSATWNRSSIFSPCTASAARSIHPPSRQDQARRLANNSPATRGVIFGACSPETPLFSSCATRRAIFGACSSETPLFFIMCYTSGHLRGLQPRNPASFHHVLNVGSSSGLAAPKPRFFSSCATRRVIFGACSPETPLFFIGSAMFTEIVSGRHDVSSLSTFCAIMDLPPPPTKFSKCMDLIYKAVSEVALESMSNAVREAVSESNNTHLTVACDGTWQKRGHTSLNGVVTTTSVNTGKVLDVHTLSKSCNICHGAKNFELHDCSINYEGYSGGMEAAGVVEIFSRSVDRYGVKYTNYLGDGDSKGFQKVKESNVYGKDIEITKLECVGHVQKRMGARLRKLKKDMKGKTLSDGKSLTGRGRLTDTEIDLLQQYYGLAIRRNAGKTIKDMQQAIWAIYFHKLSNDDAPQHGLCPPGEDSWCGYHKAQLKGDTYKHEHSLPEAVLLAIKPIFRDLARDDLLSKCLHGKTQNPNESFHHVIWERVPKTVFVQVRTLNIGLYDAVICYNDGCYSRIKVLEKMGLTISGNVKCALMNIDKRRLSEANKRAENMEKEARVRNRIEKRKRESQEEQNQQEYAAGMF
ncbi:hypothetical protein ANN_11977 [Periplaneta americana]|uniref:Mutator-like transposase domain-containing protein n=1 Tax=Periplaneta americana TaxID=6978 RepID=A0ABQ8T817_PERAM|nr:hypothetical protein ANN_11977 [Periplaneta americana]